MPLFISSTLATHSPLSLNNENFDHYLTSLLWKDNEIETCLVVTLNLMINFLQKII